MSADDCHRPEPVWRKVAQLSQLAPGERHVCRVEGRKILLLRTEDAIYACNNQCPHEGYPLSEGSLDTNCVLTCNWHNYQAISFVEHE